VLTLSESAWAEAKRRADVIRPLAEQTTVEANAADQAARQLGISKRQVYRLVRRYRSGDSLVTDLTPGRPPGGKGKSRVALEVDTIVSDVIKTLYLARQKRSLAVIVREVRMRCSQAGYRAPSRNTIRSRIGRLDPKTIARKREGGEAARKLTPSVGSTLQPCAPLDLVQIDHTVIDVIVVEETSREPIGRPSLTLAIDVFTRCIVGMLLTLEAPSATSVGLCLAHVVTDKAVWLERLGISEMTWTMHGKPKVIHLDNAPEFKSEALKRGCEQHGIERNYRPKKQPHFGSIIERVIGTAMTKVHELPGTTFSNIEERGSYDSEARAVLTLRELEKWLVLAIGTYHESMHSTLWGTPAACWKKCIATQKIYAVTNETAFLIDFLPVVRRSITRTGFLIDHITYYADVLKPWIASRDRLEKFIIRRDPRDLSRVWVLDPESKNYFDIPYRALSRPPVTLWEHRKAMENLRKQGGEQVDEPAIFRMIEQMREITETAAKERKRARRDKTRRSHLSKIANDVDLAVPNDEVGQGKKLKIFDVEDWVDTVDTPVPNDGVGRKIKPFDVEEW